MTETKRERPQTWDAWSEAEKSLWLQIQSRGHGYNLLRAAQVSEELSVPGATEPIPALTEKQTREWAASAHAVKSDD